MEGLAEEGGGGASHASHDDGGVGEMMVEATSAPPPPPIIPTGAPAISDATPMDISDEGKLPAGIPPEEEEDDDGKDFEVGDLVGLLNPSPRREFESGMTDPFRHDLGQVIAEWEDSLWEAKVLDVSWHQGDLQCFQLD